MDVDATIRHAMERYGAGDFAAARTACRKLTERGLARADVMNVLGAAELALGNFEPALRAFQRATQLNPADGSLRVNHAVAARRAQKPDLALSILDDALKADPRNLAAYQALGLLRQDLRQFTEAEADYARALELWPQSAELLAQLVTVKLELGKIDEAVRLGAKAAALAPALPVAVEARASALLQAGKYAEASAGYRQFLSLPGLPAASVQIAKEQLRDAELMERLPAEVAAIPRPVVAPSREMIQAIEGRVPVIEGRALTVVMYHVAAGDSHPYLRPTAAAEKTVDYLETARLAATSLKITNPNARLILLTDQRTELGPLQPLADIVRVPLDAGLLIYSKLRAFQAVAYSGRVRTPIAFLDTDICLNPGAIRVFDDGFDVGLTYRLGPGSMTMPINEGVILGPAGNTPPLCAFFDWYLGLSDAMSDLAAMRTRYGFDVRRWWCGQLALGALLDWKVPPVAAADRTIAGIRCRFLDCEEYNYTVVAADSAATLEKKWALHFKGAKAKNLMSAFVRRQVAENG